MDLQGGQFAILLSIVAGWSLLIIGTTKFVLSRSFKQYDEKLGVQEEAIKKLETSIVGMKSGLPSFRQYDDKLKAQEETAQKLERSLLEMKADLPLSYLRREDFIRHEVVINAKLDRLGDQITYIRENLNERQPR